LKRTLAGKVKNLIKRVKLGWNPRMEEDGKKKRRRREE
jgi:hypothetical protein